MKLIVDTVFNNVTVDRFVEVYFSEDFNSRVAAASGLKSRNLVEETIHPDGSRDRRVRLQPNVTLPTIIKKWVSEDQIKYDEVSHFDAAKNEARYHIDSKANERVKVGGLVRFIPVGTGVRRLIEGFIEIKAPFGVGGLIEKFIEGETTKGYAKIGVFLQGYLDGKR